MQHDIGSTPNSLSQGASLPLNEVTSSNVASNDRNVFRAEERSIASAECQKNPPESPKTGGDVTSALMEGYKPRRLFSSNSNGVSNVALATRATKDALGTACAKAIEKSQDRQALKDTPTEGVFGPLFFGSLPNAELHLAGPTLLDRDRDAGSVWEKSTDT